ncbi:MAG: TGS domain-containing protein [Candidatus Asgardarchaeia archaeon]
MPTNLPPEAQAAYAKHLEAETLEEKIRTLEEFLSLVPKHKGTEKLIALHRSRLVKLRKELEKRQMARRGTGVSAFSIPKEGDAQVTLVGVRGAGKTALLTALTNVKSIIGKPTIEPIQGIATCCKGVQLQIVEAPALFEGASRGIGNGKQILGLIRNADLIVLVIDLTQDIDWQMDLLLKELYSADIRLNTEIPPVEIERTGSGGILVFGAERYNINPQDIKDFLREMGVKNAVVRIFGPVTLREIVDSMDESIVYKKALVVATKGDLPGTAKEYQKLLKKVKNKFKVIPTSALKHKGLDDFLEESFKQLNLIRIWTKSEKGLADRPLVMKKGATVKDVARRIHSRFLKYFKYAVIRRIDERIPAKRVGLNYEVKDGDIIQIITYA